MSNEQRYFDALTCGDQRETETACSNEFLDY